MEGQLAAYSMHVSSSNSTNRFSSLGQQQRRKRTKKINIYIYNIQRWCRRITKLWQTQNEHSFSATHFSRVFFPCKRYRSVISGKHRRLPFFGFKKYNIKSHLQAAATNVKWSCGGKGVACADIFGSLAPTSGLRGVMLPICTTYVFMLPEIFRNWLYFRNLADHAGHKINQVVSNTRVNPLNFP